MSFIWPVLLWSLILIPILVWMYLRLQKRRSEVALRYGSLGLVQQASGRGIGPRRHLPAILFLTGLAVLCVSLARPQMVLGLPKVEGIIILAFDISGSMTATDFEPTRLEAAKKAAREFVERQPSSVQVGVVAFSESGFSVELPSNDQASILAAIDRLQPQRGTSLASGIIVSLNTIAALTGQPPIQTAEPSTEESSTPPPAVEPIAENSAMIVLLTDGENNVSPDPLAAAQFAAERGVKVHTVAIGSPEGVTIEVNGFRVHTQVDEAALQQISTISEGQYFNAGTQEELEEIYQAIEPHLVVDQDETEVTAVFAGASILLLLMGGILSMLWFSRVP